MSDAGCNNPTAKRYRSLILLVDVMGLSAPLLEDLKTRPDPLQKPHVDAATPGRARRPLQSGQTRRTCACSAFSAPRTASRNWSVNRVYTGGAFEGLVLVVEVLARTLQDCPWDPGQVKRVLQHRGVENSPR